MTELRTTRFFTETQMTGSIESTSEFIELIEDIGKRDYDFYKLFKNLCKERTKEEVEFLT
jgi:hypothetical protein